MGIFGNAAGREKKVLGEEQNSISIFEEQKVRLKYYRIEHL